MRMLLSQLCSKNGLDLEFLFETMDECCYFLKLLLRYVKRRKLSLTKLLVDKESIYILIEKKGANHGAGSKKSQ